MASNYNNPINILDSTNATSLTDGGSMTLGGGISIGKDTFIGGNVSISGTTTSFSDNVLLINKDPTSSTDTGIIFQRYTSDIQNNNNYAGIIYSEQNDSFNLGYLVSDAGRNYVSMGNLVSLNTKEITTGNINMTGDLYKNGSLYNPGSQWVTSNSDISYTTGNVNTSNLITTNISGSNLRLSGDLYVGGTLSTVNVTTTNVTTATLNLSTGLTSASARITNANITTVTAATLLNTNAVSTNVTTNSICVTGNLNVNNFIDSATINAQINSTKLNGLHYWYNTSNIVSNEFIWGPSYNEANPDIRSYILNNTGNQLTTKIRFSGYAENMNPSNAMTGKFYIANSSGILITTLYEYTVNMGTESFPQPTPGTLSIDTGYITATIPIGGSIRVTDNYPNDNNSYLTAYGTLYISVLNDTIFTTTSGNVGIGTASPAYKLDVSGTGRITTSLTTGALYSTNQTTTNIVSTNATTTNIVSTNATTTNIVGTNISAGSVRSTGVVNLTSTTAIQTTTNNYSLTSGALNVSGDIILSGTELMFAGSGVSPPTMNGRSSGSKIVLYPETNVTKGDYALGIENNFMWLQVPSAEAGYKFYQGTSANFVLATGGNVGIGAGSPAFKLDVNGNSRIGVTRGNGSADFFIDNINSRISLQNYYYNSSGKGVARFAHNAYWDTNGSTQLQNAALPAWSMEMGTNPDSFVLYRFNTSGSFITPIAVASSGNVGIGTASPGYKLDVNGAIKNNDDILMDSSSRLTLFNNTGPLQIRSGGSNTLFLNQDNAGNASLCVGGGNVGIGTTSPGYKLDVAGSGKIGGTHSEIIQQYSTTSFPSGSCTKIVGNSAAGGTTLEIVSGHDSTSDRYLLLAKRNTNTYFSIRMDGKVGVGTENPSCPLHVNGSVSLNRTYGYYSYNGSLATGAGTFTNNFSIIASHSIAGQEFDAFSDERIKKDIVDVDDISALAVLRQIQPKQYKYKDVAARGTEQVWGFIAQQVASVLDYSTKTIKEFLPNIYEVGNITDTNTVTLTTKTTSDLVVNQIIRLITEDNKFVETKITGITDSHSFTVEDSITTDKVFVYGVKVDDFHTLNKDAIFTVATAALQEVDRELQAEKTLTQQQATTIQSLETRIISLEARLTAAGL